MTVLVLLLALSLVPQVFAGGSGEAPTPKAAGSEVSADGIAWKKYAGTTLHLGMNKHIYTTTIRTVIPEFETKTGMKIAIDEYPQDEFMNKRLVDLSSGAGTFDIVMMDSTVTQSARAGWLEKLDTSFDRRDLVDKKAYNTNDISPSFRYGMNVDGGLRDPGLGREADPLLPQGHLRGKEPEGPLHL